MRKQSNGKVMVETYRSWTGTYGGASVWNSSDGDAATVVSSGPATQSPPLVILLLSPDEKLASQLRAGWEVETRRLVHIATPAALAVEVALDKFHAPHCIVVDQDFPTPDLSLFCAQCRRQWRLPLIVLATRPDIRLAVRLMQAGAVDVLTKTAPLEEIIAAIKQAQQQYQQEWQQALKLVEQRRRVDLLTGREREVVDMISDGLLNKQIAGKLNLALITVKVHRANAMRKLGARNAADLTRLILQVGE